MKNLFTNNKKKIIWSKLFNVSAFFIENETITMFAMYTEAKILLIPHYLGQLLKPLSKGDRH